MIRSPLHFLLAILIFGSYAHCAVEHRICGRCESAISQSESLPTPSYGDECHFGCICQGATVVQTDLVAETAPAQLRLDIPANICIQPWQHSGLDFVSYQLDNHDERLLNVYSALERRVQMSSLTL
ncbi:MAG: hypothetical protein R3C03_16065 [Pirellulaceae bacterium]